jgi:hypothetical protein
MDRQLIRIVDLRNAPNTGTMVTFHIGKLIAINPNRAKFKE